MRQEDRLTKCFFVLQNADDNGLWIIHATPESNHTIVSKINETTLDIVNSLNISVHHHQVGEMFIGTVETYL